MSVKFGGFLKSANMTRAFFRKTAPFIYKALERGFNKVSQQEVTLFKKKKLLVSIKANKGIRVRRALPRHSLSGTFRHIGVGGGVSPTTGGLEEVPPLGRDGQSGKPSPDLEIPHDEVPLMRRIDAIGLDAS